MDSNSPSESFLLVGLSPPTLRGHFIGDVSSSAPEVLAALPPLYDPNLTLTIPSYIFTEGEISIKKTPTKPEFYSFRLTGAMGENSYLHYLIFSEYISPEIVEQSDFKQASGILTAIENLLNMNSGTSSVFLPQE